MGMGALTDELLARAERIFRATRQQGETRLSGYHEGSGVSAGVEQGWSAEDKKKWPT